MRNRRRNKNKHIGLITLFDTNGKPTQFSLEGLITQLSTREEVWTNLGLSLGAIDGLLKEYEDRGGKYPATDKTVAAAFL